MSLILKVLNLTIEYTKNPINNGIVKSPICAYLQSSVKLLIIFPDEKDNKSNIIPVVNNVICCLTVLVFVFINSFTEKKIIQMVYIISIPYV